MFPFDSDQTRRRRFGHHARSSHCQEVVMRKVNARAIARPVTPVREAEIWTMALWLLAAVFLLATVRI
jgi:hypothetical protein